MKNTKISLTQLAIDITKKNLEMNRYEKPKEYGRKPIKKPKSTGFNVKKSKNGSLITFIPENMKGKSFVNKINNNINIIEEFKSSENNILKI